MSNTQHTPGPWTYDERLNAVVVIQGHEVKAIADFGKTDLPEANARLIVTAPELLEALQEIQTQIQQVSDGDRPYTGFDTELIDEAIAKATGDA